MAKKTRKTPTLGATTRATGLRVGRADVAAILGVSRDSLSRLVAEGMPCEIVGGGRGRRSVFDVAAVVAWQRARLEADAARRVEAITASPALEAARVRKMTADARRAELETGRLEGQLVEAADVEHRWGQMVVAMRERILTLPMTALQRGIVDDAGEEVLIALVHDALSELAGQGEATA